MKDSLELIIDSLAVWRLAFMLVHELGPGAIFQKTRRALGVETVNAHSVVVCNDQHPTYGMFCCVFCMSIWMAGIVRLIRSGRVEPVKTLAVSAGALVVDKVIQA